MGIEKLDKNMDLRKKLETGESKVYSIPSESFGLYGVFFDEKTGAFARMDTAVAESVSEAVGQFSRHTSGGRLCFYTDSNFIKIAVAYRALGAISLMPLTGSSGFSLFEKTDEEERFIANLVPLYTDLKGFTASASLKGGKMRQYVLYFPLYNYVDGLSVALAKEATVLPAAPYRKMAPIVYYGSSITHGGCANRPDCSYEALICKRNKIDFINLGFSGGARGEKVMAEYLSKLNCSLFVCDYDYNAPTVEHLKDTHYALYEEFRKAQPNTPILFLSRPDPNESNDGAAREKVVRATYLRAKRQGDNNVYFLAGKSFYGKAGSWNFAVDGCHPTDYGFAKMAEKIYRAMTKIDRRFQGGECD